MYAKDWRIIHYGLSSRAAFVALLLGGRCRNLFQLHNVHGGLVRGTDRIGAQLPPPQPGDA